MKDIDKNKIEWVHRSVDRCGRVFAYGDKFYRGVYNNVNNIKRIRRLFDIGLIDELVEKNLILPIEIEDGMMIDGNDFGIILSTQRIKNVINPTEWSYSMFRDAADLVIRLEKILKKYEYTLFDHHAYNVIFLPDGSCRHIDLGSYVHRDNGSDNNFVVAMEEYYFRQLFLWKKTGRHFNELLISPRRIDDKTWRILCHGLNEGGDHDLLRLDDIIGTIDDYDEEIHTTTDEPDWTNYDEVYFESDGKVKENTRFLLIRDQIKKYCVNSITELGCNQGAFSQYLMENGVIKHSLAVDYDEWAIDKLYRRIRTRDELNIQTAVVNLACPICRDVAEFQDRMRNQAVIAMALVHHLCLTQGMTFDEVIRIISGFAEKYIFIEFMPRGLYSRGYGSSLMPGWYNIDEFRRALEKKCIIKCEKPVAVNRILFVGEIL